MKTRNSNQHLDHDELLQAMVDKGSLTAVNRDHLAGCPACSENLERLGRRFAEIGRTARKLTPSPAKPFRLPAGQTQSMTRFFRPVWVMGFSAAMMLAIVVWRPDWIGYGPTAPKPTATAAADRQLMKEVDALVDDALPAAYQQLAYLDDPFLTDDTDADNDLLDWVVPPLDDTDAEESLL